MSEALIETRREGAALVVTFNRPKVRNAISVEPLEALIGAMDEAAADDGVAAVIFTGGPDYFSAGADLNDAQAIDGAKSGVEYFNRWHRLCNAVETMPKPAIAAIEGFCMTGGCEFALACDLRVAGEGSTFAITSSRIGTVAGAGGTQRLPRVVGASRALEILFAAEPIDAAEAYRIGLINRLTAKGGALPQALELTELYATRAPLSLAFVKRAVHRGMQMDLASAVEFEAMLVATIYGTNDRREGIAAFLERRSANFTGT